MSPMPTYSDGLRHGWADAEKHYQRLIADAQARGDDPAEILEFVKHLMELR